MNRGKNAAFALVNDEMRFRAVFVGAATTDMTKATAAQYPLRPNLGSTCVRTSIGLYVVTLTDCTNRVLDVGIEFTGTTTLFGKVKVATNTTAKTLTINVFDGAGNLADPATADTMVITFDGWDSAA